MSDTDRPGERPKDDDRDDAPPAAGRVVQDPDLNNPDATPGTGMLPPLDDADDPDAQPSG